jgi:hypothetical protein
MYFAQCNTIAYYRIYFSSVNIVYFYFVILHFILSPTCVFASLSYGYYTLLEK